MNITREHNNNRPTQKVQVRRGDIFFADLGETTGSEQGGYRPVLIIQNDIGNKFSPTVIATALTSKLNKTNIPTHITLNASENGLKTDSMVLLEQIRTLDKSRLKQYVCSITDNTLNAINQAILISFGIAH